MDDEWRGNWTRRKKTGHERERASGTEEEQRTGIKETKGYWTVPIAFVYFLPGVQ